MSDTERGRRGDRARLRAELLALGRGMDVPARDPGGAGLTMAERVLAQIVAEAVPVPVPVPPGRLKRAGAWVRRRARLLAAALSGVLVVVVLTPPVRATVADWFDFGGVEVRYDPSTPAPERPGPAVPGCDTPVTLSEAARRSGFRPVVPPALGAPEAVAVTGLPEGRSMVTLCWRENGRTVRLDEFLSRLDPYFMKQVREQPEWLTLDDGRGSPVGGLWFAQPHVLSFGMVDRDGTRWTRSQRTAGPTLLWVEEDRLTLRLEGLDVRERARAVARSTLGRAGDR
ncbi:MULTISPECIES: hypothetical protein [unclassified Streptomyces]|uniref:hypothetical protein n=1 Tax=unclassified Streptomyces TaxID=2593676 RepID=UPI0029AFFFA1|nr:hypothetical protein [Streptomyces sp. PA03-2a]MDX2727465.1 hypothetical protein [Streptomyces sp. PA03-2a]